MVPRRVVTSVVTIVAVSGLSLAVAATPATAWSGSYISSTSGGAYVRSCASTNCGAYGWAPNGRRVDMVCWKDGDWAEGNYWTNRWFESTVESGGSYYNWYGYVHASLVANQTSVPKCP